jgi:stage V sporulation protein B
MFKKSLMLFGTNILNRGVNFLFKVLLRNILTTTEFGIFSVILPVQSLILMLTSYGVTPTISRFFSVYRAKKENYIQSAFGFAFIGVILFVVLYFLAPIFSSFFGEEFSNYAYYFRIAALVVPLGMIFSIFTGIFLGMGEVKILAVLLVIVQVSSLTFGVSAAYYNFSLVFLAFSVGYVLSTIVALYFYRKNTIKGTFVFAEFKKIIRFSFPISLTAIGLVFLFNTDIVLLGHFFTPQETAVYGLVMPTARLIPAFSIALAAVVLPEIAEKTALNSGVSDKVTHSFSLTLAMSIPIGLAIVAFSEEILYVLSGDSAGAAALKVLALGMITYSLYYTASSIFQGTERPGIPMKIIICTALLNIVLNFLLIPKYDIFGAGTATSFSCIFAAGVSLWLLNPRISFDLRYLVLLVPLFVFEYVVGLQGRLATLAIYGVFGGVVLLLYFYAVRTTMLSNEKVF